MTEMLEIYKCEICGNMIEVVHTGRGQLVCCGQPMNLCEENTTDAAYEKHVPVVEMGDEIFVKVGSTDHPMEEEHHIEWIELITDGEKTCLEFLSPGQKPVASFHWEGTEEVTVRAYCNLHGLWKAEE